VPIVQDCESTLKQLETMMETYGSGRDAVEDRREEKNGKGTAEIEGQEKDMVALTRTKLANQKTSIEIVLDSVQLHNPVKARRMLEDTDDWQLDRIKDKVDAIAMRIFRRRSSASTGAEGDLWEQFRSELEIEGFSSEVLLENEVRRSFS
jgi:hypothetical protein